MAKTKNLAILAVIGIAIYFLAKKVEAAPSADGMASVEGTVKDEVTRQPLSGVFVGMDGLRGLTDANGYYEISNISPGTYDIVFSKAGYYPAGWALEITAGTHIISYVLYPIS